jgi:hypothetical protein
MERVLVGATFSAYVFCLTPNLYWLWCRNNMRLYACSYLSHRSPASETNLLLCGFKGDTEARSLLHSISLLRYGERLLACSYVRPDDQALMVEICSVRAMRSIDGACKIMSVVNPAFD